MLQHCGFFRFVFGFDNDDDVNKEAQKKRKKVKLEPVMFNEKMKSQERSSELLKRGKGRELGIFTPFFASLLSVNVLKNIEILISTLFCVFLCANQPTYFNAKEILGAECG